MDSEIIYEDDEIDRQWPKTQDLTCDEIAAKVRELCTEMKLRTAAFKSDQLSIAKQLWPDLHAALYAKGKRVALNGGAEPVWPDWAPEPVVPLDWHYRKEKSKGKAELLVRAYGDGGWATMGELWQWLHDSGPIMSRGMARLGYLNCFTDGYNR